MAFKDLSPDEQIRLKKIFSATDTNEPMFNECFDYALKVHFCEHQRISLYNEDSYCHHPSRNGSGSFCHDDTFCPIDSKQRGKDRLTDGYLVKNYAPSKLSVIVCGQYRDWFHL